MPNWKKVLVSGSEAHLTSVTSSNGVQLADDAFLNLGDGNDLQLYHDGDNSYIKDAGTGGLFYRGGTQTFQNAAGSKTMAVLNAANSVDLNFNDSTKFQTTNTGVSVTGEVTATGNVSSSLASTGSFGRTEGTSFSYVFDSNGSFVYDGDELVYRNSGNEKFKVDNSQMTTETGNFTNLIKIGGENKIQLDESSVSLVIKQNDGGMVDNLTMTKEGELTLHRGGATINGDISGSVIRASGDVVAFNSSDKRLKDNIVTIGSPLQKIGRIGGYEFDWNENQHVYRGHDVGVIAQEIEEVIPEAVKDRDGGYKGVQYDKIIPLLIEGIKELTKKTKKLEKEIRVLRHKS